MKIIFALFMVDLMMKKLNFGGRYENNFHIVSDPGGCENLICWFARLMY